MTRVTRALRNEERDLLCALAEHDPQHSTEYRNHIAAVVNVEDWNDGTHSITIVPSRNKEIRVEAVAEDEDGERIQIIFWADEGRVCLLEMLRGDDNPVKRYPARSSLKEIEDYQGNPRPAGWL